MTNQELQNRIVELERLVHALVLSDRYDLSKTLALRDGRNIQVGTTTGTKIGTTATQKLGFFGGYNGAPVTQRGPIGTIASGSALADIRMGLIQLGLFSGDL